MIYYILYAKKVKEITAKPEESSLSFEKSSTK